MGQADVRPRLLLQETSTTLATLPTMASPLSRDQDASSRVEQQTGTAQRTVTMLWVSVLRSPLGSGFKLTSLLSSVPCRHAPLHDRSVLHGSFNNRSLLDLASSQSQPPRVRDVLGVAHHQRRRLLARRESKEDPRQREPRRLLRRWIVLALPCYHHPNL